MKQTTLALLLAGIASTACADSWLYGGVAAGASSLKGASSQSYNIHAGTGILPFIGVEGGYTFHGNFEDQNTDLSAYSFYAALKPSINFGDLQVYAKSGAHYWNTDGRINDRTSDNSIGFMWEIGADYLVFGPLALGASYSNYKLSSLNITAFNVTATLHVF